MNWIDKSIEEYYNWLRNKTIVLKSENTDWNTIITPLLGLFNDNIEIYAKLENDKVILSDDGVTFSNLELAGAPIMRPPKRKEWLDMILLNYGIVLENNELKAVGNEKIFFKKA
jgi:hypothetical protein